jgi:xylulokinase
MEGVAFMLKRNVEYIEQAGISIREIISSGGGSRSRLWNQIKANVCDKPVVILQNKETALLGDAILAGTAVKIFTSVQDGCQKMVAPQEKFEANEEKNAYIQPYKNYCELDGKLSEFFVNAYSEKPEK